MDVLGNSLGSHASQDIAITVTIKDIDGNPANPTNVRFTVRRPGASQIVDIYDLASPNVQTVQAGTKYRCIFDAPVSGFWRCRMEATNSGGQVVAVDEATYYVAP